MPRELFANPLAQHSAWLEVAERVADEIRATIVDREQGAAIPRDLVELFRAHHLLTLAVPVALGGAGESWGTAAEVTRIIARADAGIAHALGYHYTWLWFVARYGTPAGEAIARRSVERQWFWASIGSAFGGSGSIRADDDGYIIEAERGFATGAPLADVLFTQSVSADDGRLYVSAVETSLPGVTVAEDWDAVGQRLSVSTGVRLDAVRIGADAVVTVVNPPTEYPQPVQSLMIPSFQLLFGYLNLGIAEGALLEARDYVLEHGRPWVHAEVERAADDPYIATLFGEHAAKVQGVADQVRSAERVLAALLDGGLEITRERRGQVAELIGAAKVVSQRVGLDATSAVFEATGARSSARRFGLDRHWRNIRTISLHDPISYKLAELGDSVLNGTLPQPSVYR